MSREHQNSSAVSIRVAPRLARNERFVHARIYVSNCCRSTVSSCRCTKRHRWERPDLRPATKAPIVRASCKCTGCLGINSRMARTKRPGCCSSDVAIDVVFRGWMAITIGALVGEPQHRSSAKRPLVSVQRAIRTILRRTHTPLAPSLPLHVPRYPAGCQ